MVTRVHGMPARQDPPPHSHQAGQHRCPGPALRSRTPGPHRPAGGRHLQVLCNDNRFSRWSHAVPLQNIQAETVATAFYSSWISLFGTPLTITTDQGAQFESSLFTALAKLVGASKVHTSPYHPQSNRILERWHRTLKTALMCHPHVPWPNLPPTVFLGLRTAFKEDLGASPAELLFFTLQESCSSIFGS